MSQRHHDWKDSEAHAEAMLRYTVDEIPAYRELLLAELPTCQRLHDLGDPAPLRRWRALWRELNHSGPGPEGSGSGAVVDTEAVQ